MFVAFSLIWAGTLAYLLRLVVLRRQLEARLMSLQDRAKGMGPENG
jgi:CcmD family protein